VYGLMHSVGRRGGCGYARRGRRKGEPVVADPF